LCGIAIAVLHLSTEEFYELAPIEFKYAIKIVNEREKEQFKTKYEVARYLARHIWNSAGRSLKKGYEYKEPKEVGLFNWEVEEKLQEKQTPEEIKGGLLRIFGGAVKKKK
jgi:hypothetical protein